jgi:hypothetical protein
LRCRPPGRERCREPCKEAPRAASLTTRSSFSSRAPPTPTKGRRGRRLAGACLRQAGTRPKLPQAHPLQHATGPVGLALRSSRVALSAVGRSRTRSGRVLVALQGRSLPASTPGSSRSEGGSQGRPADAHVEREAGAPLGRQSGAPRLHQCSSLIRESFRLLLRFEEGGRGRSDPQQRGRARAG